MPPKTSTACSKVITIPQTEGTCWWNALLMAMLYSQHANKMWKHISKSWKVGKSSNPRLERVYGIFHEIVMKYQKMKNTTPMELQRAYAYFNDITPQHILEMLHVMDASRFPLNPVIHTGFNAQYYMMDLFKLLKARCFVLDVKESADGTLEFLASKLNKINYHVDSKKYVHPYLGWISRNDLINYVTNSKDLDVIALVYGIKDDSNQDVIDLKVKKRAAALVPDSVYLNGTEFNVDGSILGDFRHDVCGHEIAGIRCNNKPYVYNGWLSKTRDTALGNELVIGRGAYPCELMPYDWIHDTDDFCISESRCGLDKEKAKAKVGLCFNFSKSYRVIFYINSKFSKPKYKDLVNRESPIINKQIDEEWTEKHLKCARQVANWSNIKPYHKLDDPSFDAKALVSDAQVRSPKAQALMDKIQELNAADIATHGHTFKHFIFSDVDQTYGVKVLAGLLTAHGYENVYDNKHKILKKGSKPRFILLTKGVVFKEPLKQASKKALLALYNARPGNIHGQDVQIILLDSGFKEGIDLFDVRYVHIFEPQVSLSDQRQVIGRATRRCGQKGLQFVPNKGWFLDVFVYDSNLPEVVKDRKYPISSMSELYLARSGIDIRQFNLVSELEKYTAKAAVDANLNKDLHAFKPKKVVGGAARIQNAYALMQSAATKAHTKYGKWRVNEFRNMCEDSGTSPAKFEFHPSQEFLRHYVRPDMKTNGILLFHTVGSGKTCSAIAAASSSFENTGYTILWVTRSSLKQDMWKNMFEQICNINLQGMAIPKEAAKRRALLSKAWRIQPMSYKQFTNLLQGKNAMYKTLVSINGKDDPLRKTLLIIDEAHKLFNATDLSAIERPDVNTLYKWLRNSYKISKNDAVKLLLMTGTPITGIPMDYIRLLNLFKPAEEAMPDNFEAFNDVFLDAKGKFTKDGSVKFMNNISGLVSYLNTESDARTFAQPRVHMVTANISTRAMMLETDEDIKAKYVYNIDETAKDIQYYKDRIKLLKTSNPYKEQFKQLQATLKQRVEDGKELNDDALKLHKASLKQLRQEVKVLKAQVSEYDDSIKNKLTEMTNKITKLTEKKTQLKTDQSRAKKRLEKDNSQERYLRLCGAKNDDSIE